VSNTIRSQRGATLIVTLIMLMLITLVALTAMNMGKSSLQIVGNFQGRSQELVSANGVSEEVLSSTQFFNNPNATLNVAGNFTNATTVDVYGDGKTVLPVNVTPPKCMHAQSIPLTVLNLNNSDDLACTQGVSQNFGEVGAQSSASMCANSTWDISTQATDAVTGGAATVVQGVAVRIPRDDELTSCP